MAANHRSIQPECICRESCFPHGVCTQYSRCPASGTLCNYHRHFRCLLPHSHSPCFQEVFESSPEWGNTTVQSSAYGAEHLCQNLHISSLRSGQNDTQERDTHSFIHGRLDVEESETVAIETSDQVGCKSMSEIGMVDKHEEVHVRTDSDSDLCGNRVLVSAGDSTGTNKEISKNRSRSVNSTSSGRGDGPIMAQTVRVIGQCDEASPPRAAASETYTDVSPAAMVAGESRMDSSHHSPRSHQANPEVVAGSDKHKTRCISPTLSTHSDNIHGCQSGRVWSDIEQSDYVRSVESSTSKYALQQPRDASSDSGNRALQTTSQESNINDLFRQHNNSSHNKQARRDKVVGTNGHGSSALDSVRPAELLSLGPSCSGQAECVSGSAESEKSSDLNRVENEATGALLSVAEMGSTTSRSICHEAEQSTSSVCLPDSGLKSLESERSSNPVVRNVCLCIPPLGHSESGSTQGPGRSGGSYPNSTQLAHKTLVQSAARPVNRHTSQATSRHRFTHAEPLPGSTQTTKPSTSSCLAVIRQANEDKGFSKSVATRLGKGVRPSSRGIYDGKWCYFVEWCGLNNVPSPREAPLTKITDFLDHLFIDKELQVNTIKGYRASICRVIKLSGGPNYSDSDTLNELMRSYVLERPKVTSLCPKWDLVLVLDALRKPPYEPLSAASMLDVSKKTLFLLALASGARRSELHALDLKETLVVDGGKAYFLKPTQEFIAKNHNLHNGKGKFEGFKIVNIADYAGPDLAVENTLCPVRALREYLKRSKKRRGNINQLFITCNHKGLARAANKNTLSSWAKHVVAGAYSTTTDSGSSVLHRSLHEVRAVSASLAHCHNVSMEDILTQCRWQHQTTFTSFYLRDVKCQKDELHCLPPIQVAGALLGLT